MLSRAGGGKRLRAGAGPTIAIPQSGRSFLLLNPGDEHVLSGPVLTFHMSPKWLRKMFPGGAGALARPFSRKRERLVRPLKRLADALWIEMAAGDPRARQRCKFTVDALTYLVVDRFIARRAVALWKGSRYGERRIRRAISLLHADPRMNRNVEQISKSVGLSRSRFYSLFSQAVRVSPRGYAAKLCLQGAIVHICRDGLSIGEASARAGFSAQSNFTRFFSSHTGMTPHSYRERARGTGS